MKHSPVSHWLRLCISLTLCSFTVYACSGAQFTAVGGGGGSANGSSSGGSGNSMNAGGADTGEAGAAGAATKVACQGPEDCDDGDPCTVDQCGADGACVPTPKCGPTEKCCNGACGECCDQSDCDDQITCTDDVCFAGTCTHAVDNGNCKAGEYCSAVNDCRTKEACADATGCDDKDACTDDACTTGLCDHAPTKCPNNGVCCPGTGCAECCEDANCNDNDPCTKDVCSAGKCQHPGLCAAPLLCCASADKTSATCGSCCSAARCDDSVPCTKDSCTQGTCSHTADSTQCGSNSVCDPVNGCQVTAQCSRDTDCVGSACQTGSCVGGKCSFNPCAGNMKCCADGCKACCGDADCNNDNIACTVDTCNGGVCSHKADNSQCPASAPTCDPSNGGCIQCTTDAQCNDKNDCTTDTCDLSTHTCKYANTGCGKGLLCCGTTCAACCTNSDCQTGGVSTAISPVGGQKCPVPTCSSGVCKSTTVSCPLNDVCCSYGGCCPGGIIPAN